MSAPYPPMSQAWQDGYRTGMEYCLSVITPLLEDDNDMPAIRDAVRMLQGQTPAPRPRQADTAWQCPDPEPCPPPGAPNCRCANHPFGQAIPM